jgi:hypothetical protein
MQRLKGVSLSALVIAAWAGLKRDDPTLNVPLVRKILKKCMHDGMPYGDICIPIVEAIDKSGLFGKPEDQVTEGNEHTEAAAS